MNSSECIRNFAYKLSEESHSWPKRGHFLQKYRNFHNKAALDQARRLHGLLDQTPPPPVGEV